LMTDNREIQGILAAMRETTGTPVVYLERLLGDIVCYLGLPWRVIRSSSLQIPTSMHGERRILEIVRQLGAARYVNAPGGRKLYNADAFAEAGIDLRFLDPYPGPLSSIIVRMIDEDRDKLANDIRQAST